MHSNTNNQYESYPDYNTAIAELFKITVNNPTNALPSIGDLNTITPTPTGILDTLYVFIAELENKNVYLLDQLTDIIKTTLICINKQYTTAPTLYAAIIKIIDATFSFKQDVFDLKEVSVINPNDPTLNNYYQFTFTLYQSLLYNYIKINLYFRKVIAYLLTLINNIPEENKRCKIQICFLTKLQKFIIPLLNNVYLPAQRFSFENFNVTLATPIVVNEISVLGLILNEAYQLELNTLDIADIITYNANLITDFNNFITDLTTYIDDNQTIFSAYTGINVILANATTLTANMMVIPPATTDINIAKRIFNNNIKIGWQVFLMLLRLQKILTVATVTGDITIIPRVHELAVLIKDAISLLNNSNVNICFKCKLANLISNIVTDVIDTPTIQPKFTANYLDINAVNTALLYDSVPSYSNNALPIVLNKLNSEIIFTPELELLINKLSTKVSKVITI